MKPETDYDFGQFMGTLVMLQFLEKKRLANEPVSIFVLDRAKSLVLEALVPYLQMPEEDILLMIDKQLSVIIEE